MFPKDYEQNNEDRIYSGHTRVLTGASARQKLLEGIKKVVEPVGATMGPKGKLAIIQTVEGSPIVTKDGITVAKSVRPLDDAERLGAQLLVEAALRTNEQAGDGTTTTTVLAGSFCQKLDSVVAAGSDPIELKKSFEKIVQGVAERVESMAIRVDDINSLNAVATISANGDVETGTIVAKAVHTVGRDGIVSVEDARGVATTLEIADGMRLDKGYISHYFVTDREKQRVVYENCLVLCFDKKVSEFKKIVPYLEMAAKENKPLLIVAEDYEPEIMQAFVVNRTQAGLKIVAVKAPGLSHQRLDILEDLASLVGGTHCFSSSGNQAVSLGVFGTAQKVVVDSRTTTIVGQESRRSFVEKRAEELRSQLENPVLEKDQREFLKLRLSRLTSGAAVIRVGGTTELDLVEKKYRVEDALNATRSALENGILPGGGTVLAGIGIEMIEAAESPCHVLVGESLLDPFRQICQNAGKSSHAVERLITRIPGPSQSNIGWDLATESLVDLVEAGVIDPAKVTKHSVLNAGSVAATFLQTDSVIIREEEEK